MIFLLISKEQKTVDLTINEKAAICDNAHHIEKGSRATEPIKQSKISFNSTNICALSKILYYKNIKGSFFEDPYKPTGL